ncbi:MAG: molecular chaperone HtpG [Synergistales bacterium]|nr:molecular chaperone HtpG [Synergistales bacterium]
MTEHTAETFSFKSEGKQLLDLMIHSVYSHKQIFLRELISNASDALDKLRVESLTDLELAPLAEDLHIRLEPDKEQRTLAIHDNGIGMDRDEVINYIGTIAKSGTQEFLKILQEQKGSEVPAELIGQFGVGFYSSFMVADRVELITRKAGSDQAWRWVSDGEGTFTMEETERQEQGTTVILHLTTADEEENLEDYAEPQVLRRIVKRYSDFVAYPIRMKGDEEDEVLNSMKAIWTRPEEEVTEEEYNEFYKHISHDWQDPLQRIRYSAEGTSTFKALLYIPAKAPFDLYIQDVERGVQLYVRRVFIMQDCKDLIPEYLRFLRGVVDSEDLTLNISRELLQKNRQIRMIRKNITRKVLDTLKKMKNQEPDQYRIFWGEFGRVLKEGILHDEKQRETIMEMSLFPSTTEEQTSLQEYIDRMSEGQKTIYFLSGASLETLKASPHLEAFREKGYEVLLLSDQVDDVWSQMVTEFKDYQLQSAAKGAVEFGEEAEDSESGEGREKEKEQQAPAAFLQALGRKLEDHVKEVRISKRLTSSPACLVGEEHDMSPQLEQLMKSMGQEVPPTRRILEVNPGHPVVRRLERLYETNPDDDRLQHYGRLLYGQAVLAEGGTLDNPTEFSRELAEFMTEAIGSDTE